MLVPRNATYPILVGTILALVAALGYVTFGGGRESVQAFLGNLRPEHSWPNVDGNGAAAAAAAAAAHAAADAVPPPPPEIHVDGFSIDANDPGFFNFKAFFAKDLDLPNPAFDTAKLKEYKPINYDGPGRPTFAVYMSTRNSTLHDPYFAGAQQIAYRLLWDPRSRSEKYPLTVFVAPFIPQDQRDFLAAAGALVKELPTVEWHPQDSKMTDGRWRDLFSKLNVWNQTEYSRVALLDTDAFPLENIDAIFDAEQSPEVSCHRELLNSVDLADPGLESFCNYVFAGVHDIALRGVEINGGCYVLKPDKAMHTRLMREMAKGEFDANTVEQAFLNVYYRPDGPFPATLMDRKWNGFVPQDHEEGKLKVFHDKLWVIDKIDDRNVSWADHYFNDTWDDMLRLYESDEFERLRANGGVKLF